MQITENPCFVKMFEFENGHEDEIQEDLVQINLLIHFIHLDEQIIIVHGHVMLDTLKDEITAKKMNG